MRQASRYKTQAGWGRCPTRRAALHYSLPERGEESAHMSGWPEAGSQKPSRMTQGSLQEEQPRVGYQSQTRVKESTDCESPERRIREWRKHPCIELTKLRVTELEVSGIHIERHPGMGCQSPGRVRRLSLQSAWAQPGWWGHLHARHRWGSKPKLVRRERRWQSSTGQGCREWGSESKKRDEGT